MDNPIQVALSEAIERRKLFLAQAEKDLRGHEEQVIKLTNYIQKLKIDIESLEKSK